MTPLAPADLGAALLSPVLVFVCTVVAWRGASITRDPRRQDLRLLPWALATAVAWHPGVLQGLAGAHPGDSLFALSGTARTALVLLAVVASLVPFALSVAKTRRLRNAFARRPMLAPATLDVGASVLLALVALALAPPLFHAGYRRLLPELPAQRVIEGVPPLERLAVLARPAADGSLADHAAALFLWTLALAALLGWLLDVRQRRRPLGALRAGTVVATLAALWSFGALVLG